MVTIENYEEYLMMAADGELNASDKAALDAFLKAHPELADELETWESVRLQPDTLIVYADKGGLLKKEPRRIALGWKPYALAAAAAVAGLVLLLPALWQQDNELKFTSINHHFTQPLKPAIQSTPVQPVHITPPVYIAKKTVRTTAPQPQHPTPQSIIPSLTPTAGSIAEQPVASVQPVLEAQVIPEQQIQPAGSATREATLPKVRLAEANRLALDLLKQGFDERVEQATAVARSVKETAFVVKLGNVNLNF